MDVLDTNGRHGIPRGQIALIFQARRISCRWWISCFCCQGFEHIDHSPQKNLCNYDYASTCQYRTFKDRSYLHHWQVQRSDGNSYYSHWMSTYLYINGASFIHLHTSIFSGSIYKLEYIHISYIYICITGWWFGTFFMFPYIGKNHPIWRSYFSEG